MPGPWDVAPTPKPKPSRRRRLVWFGVLFAGGLALLALNECFPQSQSRFEDPYFVRLIAILILASTSLLLFRQIPLKQTLRYVLMWMAVGAVLIVGFTFQDELKNFGLRIRSELIPAYPVETGSHEMVIAEGTDGGFRVYGTINGVPVRFLIDTGASDIVLSLSDAKRLGVDMKALTFNRTYESANGIGHAAAAEVAQLSVGEIQLTNVPVSVNGTDMSSSLLGMAFLKRLKSYNFSDRRLILRW